MESVDWVDMDPSLSSSQICGFSPFELITCELTAVNAAGESDVAATPEIRTGCGGRVEC